MPSPATAPTAASFNALQTAFDHFNAQLFEGRLPPVMILIHRKKNAHGYFWPERFGHRDDKKLKVHEIALNPETMSRSDRDVLSTLVHEMCHHEQQVAAGHLPRNSVVDERSIEDVLPSEVAEFDRAHFFSGIGGWGLALERAGWPIEAGRVWTCGCPCQPFSAAGKRAGFADERHLWPAQHWLIEQCRPDVLLGEQVSGGDGLAWLDLVQADMEAAGYAGGATDLCAAGFGAPHIRQRQWLTFERLADADSARLEGRSLRGSGADQRAAWQGGVVGRLADDALGGRREEHQDARGRDARDRAEGHAAGLDPSGDAGGLADAHGNGQCRQPQRDERALEPGEQTSRGGDADGRGLEHRPGPVNGSWGAADWVYCDDPGGPRWRPVEPGTFPLAHGVPGRVGRLRAYGETISPIVAQAVAEAYLEHKGWVWE